jgi:signal transduction histidine kinase
VDEAIEMRLRRTKEYIETSVLDRGLGIDAEEVGFIFQPFYRSPKTASKAVGLGLGLAVCKRLIEIQSGQIWVTPRAVGGSEFTFALPVAGSRSSSGARQD